VSLGASHTGSLPALSPAFRQSRAGVMLLDFVLVAFGVLVAYVARFEGAIPSKFFYHMVVVAPVLAATRILVNAAFGVYRLVWRYVGLLEAVRMAQAVATVSVILLLFRTFRTCRCRSPSS
jgi:FlaA1/EpsC-like NDP-sugar epimerase